MSSRVTNYRTEVPAKESVSEIQEILGEYGAEQIMIEYVAIPMFGRQPVEIAFSVTADGERYSFRLPCRWELTLRRLRGDKRTRPAQRTEQHALNVAWRTVRMWVQAQMEFIATGQVQVTEVFLPYMLMDGRTVYEQFKAQKALAAPKGE